jgi:hypothetical protein
VTPNNVRWLLSVSRHPDLPPRAKIVAAVIAVKYADWTTLGDIRPGVKQLTHDTGLSYATVKRALVDLQAAGFLVKVSGHKYKAYEKYRRGPLATVYRATFPKRGDVADEGAADDSVTDAAPAGRPAGDARDVDTCRYCNSLNDVRRAFYAWDRDHAVMYVCVECRERNEMELAT